MFLVRIIFMLNVLLLLFAVFGVHLLEIRSAVF